MKSIKMFGLAFVAAFAMTTAAASAAEFNHEAEETARFVATNAGQGAHTFTFGNNFSLSCSKATFTGTSFVTSPQPSVEVAPAYSACTVAGVSNTKIATNGCTYVFNEPAGSGPFTGTFDIKCPAGQAMTYEISGCRIEIREQKNLGTLNYTNLGTSPKSVRVTANVSNLTYTASGFGFLCSEVGTRNNGTYSGTVIASAESEFEETVGAFIK